MAQKITPFLWFDNNAEEAMNLYISVFKDAEVHVVNRYQEGAPLPAGTLMTAEFTVCGQNFIVLNGGPQFKFTEAISFVVDCETQEEIDEVWEKLSEGGQVNQCGWLKDRFGLAWQVVPPVLGELLSEPDPEKSARVMMALFGMTKINIQALKDAYNG